MPYADIINSCMFNTEEWDQVHSDNDSIVLETESNSTDEPFPLPYFDEELQDDVFPVYINHDGGQKRFYLPLNGDVQDFLMDYFEKEDIDEVYQVEDHRVECGNQTWCWDDPPATWANLGIEANMTIYIEFDLHPIEIKIVVANGEEDPNEYLEEDLYVSFDRSDTLKDIIDYVMQANHVDLGDYFNIYINGDCKNDIYEKLGDIFWGENDDGFVMEISKIHDETSSSESEVEMETETGTDEADIEVINHVHFEGLTYPFYDNKFPLRIFETSHFCLVPFIKRCLEFLHDNKMISDDVHTTDFEIYADGRILNR